MHFTTSFCSWRPTIVCLTVLVCASALGGQSASSRPPADVVDLGDSPPVAPKVIPANTLFRVSDGERAWYQAYRRTHLLRGGSAGNQEAMAGLMISAMGNTKGFHFRKGRGFRAEHYRPDGEARSLVYCLRAGTTEKDGTKILLSNLELFYLSPGGRLRMSADSGVFDTERMSGEAKGGVSIELLALDRNQEGVELVSSTAKHASGLLKCDRIRWRLWNTPETGSTDIALYVVSDDPSQEDPLVQGQFVSFQPDGSTSIMDIQANGMIFEASKWDHQKAIHTESGDLLGKSDVGRRQAIFHRNIKVRMVGSTSVDLIPFQNMGNVAPKSAPVDPKKQKPTKPSPVSEQQILCSGPAILDMAVPPRTPSDAKPAGPKNSKKDPGEEQPVTLARRFEFLNGVRMTINPVDPKTQKPLPDNVQSDGPKASLACRHLCLGSSYAEAIGGVHMEGLMKTEAPGTDSKVRNPFRADAHRVYYDNVSNTLNFVGLPGTPVELVDDLGELSTSLCVIRTDTRTPFMPQDGPKRLVIRPSALKAPAKQNASKKPDPKSTAPSALDLDGGSPLTIKWYGSFLVERKQIPVGLGSPPIEKAILMFKRNVEIAQPEKGVKLQGESFRMVVDMSSKQLEHVTGSGQIRVTIQDITIEGPELSMDIRYDQKGQIVQNAIVIEDPSGPHVLLRQGGNAIRGQRFVFDAQTGILKILGGAVGRINLSQKAEPSYMDLYGPKKKDDAKKGVELSMDLSGKLAFQCSGDLTYSQADGALVLKDEVLIQQERENGLRILTNQMKLILAKPAESPGKAATSEGMSMFSGKPSAMECTGEVEMATAEQLIHCDELHLDLNTNTGHLANKDPKGIVRIYFYMLGGTKLLEVEKQLNFNGTTKEFDSAGRRYLLTPFNGSKPLPRNAPMRILAK